MGGPRFSLEISMSEAAEKIDEVDAQGPAATEIPDYVKPVGINRFGLMPEKHNHFVVHVPHGTDPDLCLETEFWTHVAQHLARGDFVTIEPDDLAWEMGVRVLDCGHNWANVRKRQFYEYESIAIRSEQPLGYKVEWAGQTDKFRVVFKGEVLKKGFATEALASRFVSNHAQALKR